MSSADAGLCGERILKAMVDSGAFHNVIGGRFGFAVSWDGNSN